MTHSPRSELKNTGYEIFIGILSILSILNLVLVYVLRNNHDLQTVLQVMNALFSSIFLIDFIYRLQPLRLDVPTSFGISAGQTCSRACLSRSSRCYESSVSFG